MLSLPAKQKINKKNLQIPSNDELFLYITLACVWVLHALWFRCYKLAQDTLEDVFFFLFRKGERSTSG